MLQPASPPSPRKRKWSWWIVLPLAFLVLLLILAQPLGGTIVKSKLISTVEQRTNASLKVGSVQYLPPYGVRVQDAEFLVPDEEGDGTVNLIKVKQLELKLAKLPLRPGPLVIERVTIDSPDVHLIQTDHGLLGIKGLAKPSHKEKQVTKQKLSEIFQLRHLAVTNGQITFEDRTRPHALPLVWRDLNINTETRPTSGAIYSYDFAGHQGAVGSIQSAGTFDIDSLTLDAKSLAVHVQIHPGATESAVPGPVQKLLVRYGIQGKLGVTGHGLLPLKDLRAADYQFDVSVDGAKAIVPKYPRPIDQLMARIRVTGHAKQAISTLVALEAVSGPDVLHVDDGNLAIDAAQKSWTLNRLDLRLDATAVGVRPFQIPASAPAQQQKLRAGGRFALTAAGSGPLQATSPQDFLNRTKFDAIATADDFHLQPPGFDAPVHLITGAPIHINQDVIRISNLTGRYGYDQFQITTLRLPLHELPRVIRADQLSATATFDRHTPGYPGKLGDWVEKLRPEGPFEVGGMVVYNREGSPKLDYHLLVHSDRGAINYNAGDRQVPITRMHLDATVDPGLAQLQYLEANVFGGVLSATGSVKTAPGTDPAWQAKGHIRDFDLRTSVQSLTGKEYDTQKLAGRVFTRFDLSGGKTPASVKGTAEARLYNGRLFDIPVLTDVLGRSGMGRGLVGSEAAGTCSIADSKILIHRAAAGSPTIGVQGSGTVGFDQSLDLNVIVAPLGEWKQRLDRTGIPILSKALGEVAGAVQGVVNTAASSLLYEFHVGGTGKDPKITPIPAPILTKGAASIFGTMLGAGKDTTLADEVRKNQEDAQEAKENVAPTTGTTNGGERKGG